MVRSCNYRWYSQWTILPVFFCCILFLPAELSAQLCPGSTGDPVVNIDFDRGTSFFGPPLGKNTNYFFVASTGPSDGYYTVLKRIGGNEGTWALTTNHTPDDPDGYFMAINASYEPGVFYETEVGTELCPNTTYEFAAWVINLLKYGYPGTRPNLTFTILTPDNQPLAMYNTKNIAANADHSWQQVGFLFTTTGVSRVKIRIQNNAPGGNGNDLAIDDITFRACGPVMKVNIDHENVLEKTVCDNENTPLVLKVAAQGSATLQYIWQQYMGTGWADISGATSDSLSLVPAVLPAGDYRYRMVAAEAGNFNNPACRTASPVLTIHVSPSPKISVPASLVVCSGNAIRLDVTGRADSYQWVGPAGYSSTEKSPVIENAGFQNSGIYTLTASSVSCSRRATAAVNLQVQPVPVAEVSADVTICEGASTPLSALGGTIFKWSPEAGLTDPDAANPVASPDTTTQYTVVVSNGDCTDTGKVMITVVKKISTSAGKDRVIMKGESTILDGGVTGNPRGYFWTPSDYLDDPGKLNPIANPPADMTYTLNAWTEGGCPGSTSSVLVKVFTRLGIPNAFSPNGDGVNDTWSIEYLESYPLAVISIYNRYAERIFSSTDHVKSWDGRYKGKQVPAGVYYYMINLHNGQKVLSGSLMVLH